ncbi:hypothetical protein PanWU01x14_238410 [Parasponia andersonii]|uniref:Reverse transcriptase zinc-binding domain-containing protein n=1 Tax=Parasponia andersonii TaxID=3476 RepID=A0A2P5BHN0_PARAD|nr:hypothetical protein PanWU01x14_238410 [Parasponia andersonii]
MKRKIACPMSCPWCLEDKETRFHDIWSCTFIESLWASTLLWPKLMVFHGHTVAGLCLKKIWRFFAASFGVSGRQEIVFSFKIFVPSLRKF